MRPQLQVQDFARFFPMIGARKARVMKLRAAYERPLILAALPLVLAACRATNSTEPPSTATPPLAAARWLPANEACGEATVDALDKLGGTQRVAHIPNRRTLYGEFAYGSFAEKRRVKSFTWSCPSDDPIAPVPQGYTPDWFGSWWLECPYLCGGLTFGRGQLSGHVVSQYWSTNTTYYLYVYALYTKQYIESYQIGPVTKSQKGQPSIAFASPFENGFVYPTKDAVVLEIAHPTQP